MGVFYLLWLQEKYISRRLNNKWKKLYYLELNDVQRDPFLWVFFTFYDHKKNIFKGSKKWMGEVVCNLVITALFTEQEQERDCIEKLIESNLVQASC